MAASFTDVLIMFCTLPTDDVVMRAEKARKRMSDSGDRWALIENCCTASNARREGFASDSGVIDFVAQECAFR